MTTVLGVDPGTTFTSAALTTDGATEIVRLEDGSSTMPSVVAFDGDRAVAGSDAERLLAERPTSGAREFKRRLGDTTPYVLDGVPRGAEDLTGRLLAVVVDRCGVRPDQVVLAHPASWGEYKLELLRDAARLAGIDDLVLVPEPVAAARHYGATHQLGPGSAVLVYDFGGGTFDSAVVRAMPDGLEVVGRPEGLERLGGVDVDQIVLAHVDRSLDGALAEADTSDAAVRASLLKLRADCVEAKVALSHDTETTVPVRLPGLVTDVRMTRVELEAALDPRLGDTLAACDRVLAGAGVSKEELHGVVLVGGSAQIPLVRERVAAHLGRPVLDGIDPLTAVACGAASATPPEAAPEAPEEDVEAGEGAAPVVGVVGRAQAGTNAGPGWRSRLTERPKLGTVGRAAAAAGVLVGGYAGWQVLAADSAGATETDAAPGSAERDAAAAFVASGGAPPALAGSVPRGAEFSDTPHGRISAAVFGSPRPSPTTSPGATESSASPGQAHTTPTSSAATSPTGSPTAAPIAEDPRLDVVRAELRQRLEQWRAPDGADPEDVAALRADLDGLLDRFHPYPGQPVDEAVATLRYEFEDRVRDFAQDQRIEAVLEEQRRQVEESLAVDRELEDYKQELLERLDRWQPPPGADPEEVAALRARLESMVDRATAVPGQTADEAIADLRLDFNDAVGDFAQDLKIEALADADRRDEEAAEETGDELEDSLPLMGHDLVDEMDVLLQGRVVTATPVDQQPDEAADGHRDRTVEDGEGQQPVDASGGMWARMVDDDLLGTGVVRAAASAAALQTAPVDDEPVRVAAVPLADDQDEDDLDESATMRPMADEPLDAPDKDDDGSGAVAGMAEDLESLHDDVEDSLDEFDHGL